MHSSLMLGVLLQGAALALASPAGAEAPPALIPDLNRPFAFSSSRLMQRVPLPYQDMEDARTFIVVPLSFRVHGVHGTRGLFVARLEDGSVRLRATLAPYPSSIEDHPAFRELLAAMKEKDPGARLSYPTLREPKVTLLAPLASWLLQAPRIIRGADPLIGGWDLSLAVKREFADAFLLDLTRDLGVMGQFTFVISARSGNQIIDWPVTLAWFLGDKR